jgi:hypothetical protein
MSDLLLGLVGAGVLLMVVGVACRRWVLIGSGVFLVLASTAPLGSPENLLVSISTLGGAAGAGTELEPRLFGLALGTLAGASGVILLNGAAWRRLAGVSPWAEVAGGIGGAVWGLVAWQNILLYLNQVTASVAGPILDLDAIFFRYTLPFFDRLHQLLVWVAAVCLASRGLAHLLAARGHEAPPRRERTGGSGIAFMSGVLGLVLASGVLLQFLHGLAEHLTRTRDVAVFAATLTLSMLPLVPAASRRIAALVRATTLARLPAAGLSAAAAWVAIGLVWLVVSLGLSSQPAQEIATSARMSFAEHAPGRPEAAVWPAAPTLGVPRPPSGPALGRRPVHL